MSQSTAYESGSGSAGTVIEASVDKDLHPFKRDGVEVIQWMAQHGVWPHLVRVHTANREASTKICKLLEENGYRGIPGHPRHFVKSVGAGTSARVFATLGHQSSPASVRKLR